MLRKELIHAQQEMDKITRQKEEEIAEQIATIRILEQQRQEYVYNWDVTKCFYK